LKIAGNDRERAAQICAGSTGRNWRLHPDHKKKTLSGVLVFADYLLCIFCSLPQGSGGRAHEPKELSQ
jgi:hypothetical protein